MSYSIANLKAWIEQHLYPSYDIITGALTWERRFIPVGSIEAHLQTPANNYWRTRWLLHEIFPGVDPPPVSPKVVSEKCCRVLCILVVIEHPELIKTFVANDSLWDYKLPFDSRMAPPDFPQSLDGNLYGSFVKHQSHFFAPIMENMDGWWVKPERIFPFTKGNQIHGNRTSAVHKVQVHEQHDKLVRLYQQVQSIR